MSGMQSATDAARSSVRALWQRLPQPAKDAAKSAWSVYATLTPRSRVLPDFVIIGTQRGGTTSLYKYLVQHPDVAHALTKELRFFDLHYDKGLDWYRSRFPSRRHLDRMRRHRGQAPVVGEASPDYMFDPHVPDRVASALPRAKFIVLLRNPVDRAYSHYWHQFKRGHETLPFADAIDAEERRLEGELEKVLSDPAHMSYERHHHSYVARGAYAEQLESWMRLFPKDRFFIESSEELFMEPGRVYGRVLEFLELPAFEPPAYDVFNAFGSGSMDPALRARLVEHFRPRNQRLYELVGRDFGWDR